MRSCRPASRRSRRRGRAHAPARAPAPACPRPARRARVTSVRRSCSQCRASRCRAMVHIQVETAASPRNDSAAATARRPRRTPRRSAVGEPSLAVQRVEAVRDQAMARHGVQQVMTLSFAVIGLMTSISLPSVLTRRRSRCGRPGCHRDGTADVRRHQSVRADLPGRLPAAPAHQPAGSRRTRRVPQQPDADEPVAASVSESGWPGARAIVRPGSGSDRTGGVAGAPPDERRAREREQQ